MNKIKCKKHFSVFQIITLGFLAVILIGSLLLMLPLSTDDGTGASFSDALFTATSATCVTGLVIQDTGTYWSSFGQAVILTMIQIGGMGVVTLAVIITLLTGKKVSLMQRNTLKEAIIMAPVFCREFGLLQGIWYAIFHSVSAFCNAGFDLIGGFVISCLEDLPLLPCLFETASAIGTVGLTLGLTPSLSIVSRIILIVLMFLGRVGCLTLVYAAASAGKPNLSKLPQAKITVG